MESTLLEFLVKNKGFDILVKDLKKEFNEDIIYAVLGFIWVSMYRGNL